MINRDDRSSGLSATKDVRNSSSWPIRRVFFIEAAYIMKSLHAQERSAWNDDGDQAQPARRGSRISSQRRRSRAARKDSDYSRAII